MFLPILIAGFGGGLIRGLVGFIKHQFSYKNVGFDLPYFFSMCFLSGVVGVLVAAAGESLGMRFFQGTFTPALAFFIGYAGGDFIENVVKIILKRPELYSFNEKS